MATRVQTRTDDADLPVELTSLVGRRQEVNAVKVALSEARMVTLAGVGGVGKTRLAVRVATELRRAFADGVWFIDLSTVLDRAALGSSVLRALRIGDQSDRDPTEVISEFLRERQMLLVLDNCEQIVDACAALIDAVIRRAPLVRVLATSRERLWVTGEYVWQVPPLFVSGPDLDTDLARSSPAPARYPALVLFAERAAAVGGGSAVREDWPDVARLCRRLDGLPLAIELAAVQTRVFTPGQLVRRFDERLGSVGTLDRAIPARHRTLEAAIDWSHDLCSPQERLLWARSSVFAGWFGLDAAEGVCSSEDLPRERVLDLVAGLVDKSILVHEEHLGEVQYRLLETLAQYGRDRLRAAGQEGELLRRHRDWHLHLAEQMATQWHSAEQLSWSRRLRRDYPNLRAAMEYCLSTPGEEHAGMRFTAALLPYWHGSGQLIEGRLWLERALATDSEPTLARFMTQRTLSSICSTQRDFAAAEAALQGCRTLARHLHDPLIDARTLATEAQLAVLRDDYAAGVAHTQAALAIPEYGGIPERAEALCTLTIAHAMLGHYDEAVTAHEEAERCSAKCGERYFLCWSLVGRSIAEFGAGEHSSVIRYTRKAVAIAREFTNSIGMVTALILLVCSTVAADDSARGAVLLGARQRICRAFGIADAAQGAERDLLDAATAQIRAELGEALYEAGVTRGLSFDFDEAVDYALTSDEPAPPPAAGTAQAESSPLTAREEQVAELVAQGLSNKEIAAALVISQRTAEGHVQKILVKLGFTSRAHIATWAAHQGH
ncbi:LuxR C-terminal-related transcriptional regulator [Kitasatospora sp. NBC_00240]|uniref:ATP-binding protein n=1 Tax=Kitasatospora sp. NBC_00240 TaxID=2903567 RepID=UPI002258BB9F|nr:LuxR C-terminal-related transcriptional regulator [Kitasatospora sp. NBC_00240]MCX5208456.1 LuxR C-terminal-related transcriptional regulator [Kitasatospora sp. NBC_00240]